MEKHVFDNGFALGLTKNKCVIMVVLRIQRKGNAFIYWLLLRTQRKDIVFIMVLLRNQRKDIVFIMVCLMRDAALCVRYAL